MEGSDTHYCSGEEIRAGDLVKSADWTGRIVFVLGNGSFAPRYSPADWSYLGGGLWPSMTKPGWSFRIGRMRTWCWSHGPNNRMQPRRVRRLIRDVRWTKYRCP